MKQEYEQVKPEFEKVEEKKKKGQIHTLMVNLLNM